jgi:histidinol-phosphate phosphatase family protein
MALAAPAVFLDKDGTLVRDVPFNDDPALVELMPGVAEGLRMLAEAGFGLYVVTNQSGMARGLMTESGLAATLDRTVELLEAEGAAIGGVYACKHHPEAVVRRLRRQCGCRGCSCAPRASTASTSAPPG